MVKALTNLPQVGASRLKRKSRKAKSKHVLLGYSFKKCVGSTANIKVLGILTANIKSLGSFVV